MMSELTVHCFASRCKHAERGADARVVHDAMEEHYYRKHREYIEAVTGTEWKRAPKPSLTPDMLPLEFSGVAS